MFRYNLITVHLCLYVLKRFISFNFFFVMPFHYPHDLVDGLLCLLHSKISFKFAVTLCDHS